MAIRDKYFTGTSVSRYLPPGEHSWDEAVYQSGKPVLDAELNLSQEVGRQLRSLVQQRTVPSGWLRVLAGALGGLGRMPGASWELGCGR